jgi:type IV secretion system protein VirD4
MTRTTGGVGFSEAVGGWARRWWDKYGVGGLAVPALCALFGPGGGIAGLLFGLAFGTLFVLGWARGGLARGAAVAAAVVYWSSLLGPVAPLAVPFFLILFSVVALLVWLSRGREARPHYHAHFASSSETSDMRAATGDDGLPGDGRSVLLARHAGEVIGVGPGFDGRTELGHFLVCGPSRSGKGLHLVTNFLAWRGSAIALDVKGELHRLTASWRRERFGGEVRVLDPSGRGDRYDPFAELSYSPEALGSALELVMETDKGRDPVFAQRAAYALRAAVLGAQLEGAPTLPYIREVTSEGPVAFVEHLAGLGDREVRRSLVDFLGARPEEMGPGDYRSDRFLASTWSTMTSRLAPFVSEGVLKMCGGSDFSAADLVERPTTLYLRFRETELEYTQKVFQVVTLALIAGLMRRGDLDPGSGGVPMLLALDEAGRTPIPRLDNMVSTVAGRGMSAVVYVQDLAQLEAAYGRERAATIRSGCHSQLYYRPTDQRTAEHVSRILGNTSVEDIRVTRKGFVEAPSRSYGQMKRELMTPDEVRTRLGSDEVIAVAGAKAPIRAKRLEWFRLLPGAEAFSRESPAEEPRNLPAPRVDLGDGFGPLHASPGPTADASVADDHGTDGASKGGKGEYVEPDY